MKPLLPQGEFFLHFLHCLLDGGCPISFIHESVVKALKLPVVRQETLHLRTSQLTTKGCSDNKTQCCKGVARKQRIQIEAAPLKCVLLS